MTGPEPLDYGAALPVAARLTAGAVRGFSSRPSFACALAVLSFIVYLSAIFALPQVRNARYWCEQGGLAAAVSNIRYGSPLGSLYTGVYDYLVAHSQEPLEHVLEAVQMPGSGLPATPPGELYQTTRDGIGVGSPLIATAAFRLFGLHAWALPLLMLVLMLAATLAFLARFFATPFTGIVTLCFSALTAMLFTPLVWNPVWADQIPIGGERYFSLVGVLPMFHILLTLLDPQPTQPRVRNAVLLGAQAAILALTMLVRGSALALVGAIAVASLVLAWQGRRDRDRLLALLGRLSLIGLVVVGVVAAIAASAPRYLSEGRFGTVVWHRITVSLGVNPDWPFAGVTDMFDCKEQIPQGIQGGMPDTNGHCIFHDYLAKHNIPADAIVDEIYGPLYESVLRGAFFKIAARHPYQTLKTFFYYKPQWIVRSIVQSMPISIAPYPPLAAGLLLVSLGVALAAIVTWRVTMFALRRMAGVTLLLALSTIPAYLAAWAMPHTTSDLLFYCLFAIGLALVAVVMTIRALAQLSMPETAKDFG